MAQRPPKAQSLPRAPIPPSVKGAPAHGPEPASGFEAMCWGGGTNCKVLCTCNPHARPQTIPLGPASRWDAVATCSFYDS